MTFNNSSLPFVQLADITFGVVDYVVFAAFLAISGAVGVFFSCRGQKTTSDYFFGNRQLKPVPVGISAGVSFMSGAAFIGFPSESYVNGFHYMIGTIFGSIGFFCGNMLIATVVHPLKMTNLNQYFAKRFKSKIILYVTHVMVLGCIAHYMGVCMLSAVIAFNGITGGQVSIVLALAIGFVVGIFYTSLGGMKAVIWTDVIQFAIMFLGIVLVVIKSIADTSGGMKTIFEKNIEYGRIHKPNWSTDITVRHTMWGMLIGCFCNWLIWSSQPANVQRLCSTNSKKDGFIVAVIGALMFMVFSILPSWAGINIFGYYANRGCDIHAAGWVKENQIILYYVRERLAIPGFQGLFVAAIYACSLSSLSSGLNAAAAIIWKDIALPIFKIEISERKATIISKVIVVVFGLLSIIWCYILHSFGGLILQVGASIDSSIVGAYFGLFLLALFFRYVNYKGAVVGMIVSFSLTLWLGLGSLRFGHSKRAIMPSPIHSCSPNNGRNFTLRNATNVAVSSTLSNDVNSFRDFVYSISYIWLSPICLTTMILIALLVSACTKPVKSDEVNKKLLIPICRPGYFTKFNRDGCSACRCDEFSDTDEEEKESIKKAVTDTAITECERNRYS